jgi:hypothetical protein
MTGPLRPSATPTRPDDRPKHVIASYVHRTESVECVCGWTGSSASPDGRSSPWSVHVALNRTSKA